MQQNPRRAGGDFPHLGQPVALYWNRESRRSGMFRGGGNCLLGICAVALGAGILIAAIFPVGALLFLVAFLLIACGCACCRR